MSAEAPRRAALAVFFVSAALLAYEILLVRIFAIQYFHHFATMAISIAMLGFGAGGIVLLVRPPRSPREISRLLRTAALLTPILLLACPLLAERISLDPTQLPSDPREWPKLLATYLLLAVPFFSGALAILSALVGEGKRLGLLYGASFLGAGVGVAAAMGAAYSPWIGSIEVTPYKGLPQVEAYPQARRTAQRASPVGWLVAVDAPAFRYAPGLSLTFRGEFPRQVALFVDGQLAGALSAWRRVNEARPLVAELPTSLPYALPGRERVLVLAAGGGMDVWAALAGGATDVTAVDLHPGLVRLATASLREAVERSTARVRWIAGDARGFVARSRERFDLITLGAGGAFGTSAAGIHALDEDFLHTTEAYSAYLGRLSDGGVLAVTRWLTVPPRPDARAILTAAEALRRRGSQGAARGLVVARSWATVTVLAKPSGFSDTESAALRAWAESHQVDLDWYPGLGAPPGDRFNFLEGDVHFEAARAATVGGSSLATLLRAYPFDISPATDARPYPHHFMRARSVGVLFSAGRGSWLPFAEWGYVTLLATLAQAALLGALLFLPVGAIRARSRAKERLSMGLPLYFAAIGLAYLTAEIAAIQHLSLLLGHPVYAVAAVLAALLLFSGAGSVWSDRLGLERAGAGLVAVALILGLYAAALLPGVGLAQGAPFALRAFLAIAALAPVAFVMGWAFPVGLRFVAGDDVERRAWAWAVNGFASVVAAPLSGLTSLTVGSRTLFALAAAGYLVAAVIALRGGSTIASPRGGTLG